MRLDFSTPVMETIPILVMAASPLGTLQLASSTLLDYYIKLHSPAPVSIVTV